MFKKKKLQRIKKKISCISNCKFEVNVFHCHFFSKLFIFLTLKKSLEALYLLSGENFLFFDLY